MSKRLLRMLAGVAFVGASVAIVPALPASANHDAGPNVGVGNSPEDDNKPNPANNRGAIGAIDGWHEEMPDQQIVADPNHVCAVDGRVGASKPAPPSTHPAHAAPAPSIDDPAHSHFDFLGVNIVCDDITVVVTADGGNDGHKIDDYYLPTSPGFPCGQNGLCVEDDKLPVVGADCVFEHDVRGFNAGSHHGAMTESGWSHSSGFSDGPAACAEGGLAGTLEDNGGRAGPCVAPANVPALVPVAPANLGNNNKADIIINGARTPGDFVKYIRIGNVVDFWGCSNRFQQKGAGARRFMGELVIIPNPADPNFPVCVAPGPPGCDLILTGAGVRGNTWL